MIKHTRTVSIVASIISMITTVVTVTATIIQHAVLVSLSLVESAIIKGMYMHTLHKFVSTYT